MPGMVPTSDFSGLVSSSCAWARAAAIVPIDSLERCMTALHGHEVETDCTGLRTLGPDPMAIGFLGVLRHERLELALCLLMLGEGWPRSAVDAGELGPGVRFAHVDRPDRFDARPGWLNPEEPRDGENRAPRADHPHVVLELCHVLLEVGP